MSVLTGVSLDDPDPSSFSGSSSVSLLSLSLSLLLLSPLEDPERLYLDS